MSCPLDCEYLLEARRHERFEEIPESQLPNRDIPVTEEFLETRDPLLGFLSMSLLGAAAQTPNAIDADVREALAAMIQTLRTSRSGLIYETKPPNPIAAAIQDKVNQNIASLRERMAERSGGSSHIPDTDLLGIFVFLHRVALVWDNKRPKSRSFMSFLIGRQAGMAVPPGAGAPEEEPSPLAPPAAGSSLIIP
ncbi:MAG: hypothetical protein JNK87_01460 [Bryobacterales bacterium]|nr:hypothetical protein [Bryobacterales bacterium]